MTAAELQAAALEHRRAGLAMLQACDRLRAAGADDDAAADAVFAAWEAPIVGACRLALNLIRADGTQVRAGMDPATVDHYAEAMQAGERFPPVTVYRDADGVHWLADGHHRVEAARQAGMNEIDADIREGDRAAALWHAVGANARHGLRPSAADLRNAVTVALRQWPNKSQREIAAQVGCSVGLVNKVRADVFTVNTSPMPETRVDSLGRIQPTSKRQPEPEPEPPTLEEMMARHGIVGVHPVLERVPPMTHRERERLTADIRHRGCIHPIVVSPDGWLLDGRERLLACGATGQPVPIDRLPDELRGREADVVHAMNACRKSLTAADLLEARERAIRDFTGDDLAQLLAVIDGALEDMAADALEAGAA